MAMRKYSYHPPSRETKTVRYRFGEHFSKHVHGMFFYPRATIKKVVAERTTPMDLTVPIAIMFVAGVMSAFGRYFWGVLLSRSALAVGISLLRTGAAIVYLPIYFLILWILASFVFHFIGSILTGKDISNPTIMHKTMKLVGISFAPLFLNILPFFGLFTWFWAWFLCRRAMEDHYRTSQNGSILITLPMLVFAVWGFLHAIGIL